MTTLSETDAEVLELAVLQVPWHLVCGEFHQQYGSAGALAGRLFELQRAGLLTIEQRGSEQKLPTPQVLEVDALENGCYDGFDSAWEPRWDIMTTQEGFALIKSRLDEQ